MNAQLYVLHINNLIQQITLLLPHSIIVLLRWVTRSYGYIVQTYTWSNYNTVRRAADPIVSISTKIVTTKSITHQGNHKNQGGSYICSNNKIGRRHICNSNKPGCMHKYDRKN